MNKGAAGGAKFIPSFTDLRQPWSRVERREN
jgi:hypothetical protein